MSCRMIPVVSDRSRFRMITTMVGALSVKLLPIQVECYAGGKADESPRRFTWEGRTIDLEEILDRWYQVESKPEWPRADYFKVRGVDQREYLLKHDLEADEWYLGRQW